jgi:hypothetical protein
MGTPMRMSRLVDGIPRVAWTWTGLVVSATTSAFVTLITGTLAESEVLMMID